MFLDEIGDLPPSLQPKLLPVLSGAPFYRIGGEGNTQHELRFTGITIAASWKQLNRGLVRPDLLSRISAYVINVPGIADRPEDFDLLFEEVQNTLLASMRGSIDSALIADPEMDGEYWRARSAALRPTDERVRQRLSEVDWSRHGNLRGLTGALEQILAHDADAEEVIRHLPVLEPDDDSLGSTGQPSDWVARLLERTAEGDGLAGHVRALEVEQRLALRARLLADGAARQRLARKLGISESKLSQQINQLGRTRRRSREEEEV